MTPGTNRLSLFDITGTDRKNRSRVEVASLKELRSALENFIRREPGFVELLSATGMRLQLGLGGPLACAQFIGQDTLPPYLCAQAPSPPICSGVEFDLGGSPTPIAPQRCIGVEDALRIAEHFFLTGERDPLTNWEEV